MLKTLLTVLLFAFLFFIAESALAPKGVCVTFDREFTKVTRCFKIGKGQ